ncbi:hypothetical protein F5Y19DRAFT_486163 [Xylariaceae sp. FL1651]|nr:hypothetical protein F5Y19DRAFT_486163 [Xylariaceae sp. FL1651]
MAPSFSQTRDDNILYLFIESPADATDNDPETANLESTQGFPTPSRLAEEADSAHGSSLATAQFQLDPSKPAFTPRCPFYRHNPTSLSWPLGRKLRLVIGLCCHSKHVERITGLEPSEEKFESPTPYGFFSSQDIIVPLRYSHAVGVPRKGCIIFACPEEVQKVVKSLREKGPAVRVTTMFRDLNSILLQAYPAAFNAPELLRFLHSYDWTENIESEIAKSWLIYPDAVAAYIARRNRYLLKVKGRGSHLSSTQAVSSRPTTSSGHKHSSQLQSSTVPLLDGDDSSNTLDKNSSDHDGLGNLSGLTLNGANSDDEELNHDLNPATSGCEAKVLKPKPPENMQ